MITASGIEGRARRFVSMLQTYQQAAAGIRDADVRERNWEVLVRLELALTDLAEQEDKSLQNRQLSREGHAARLAELAHAFLSGPAMQAVSKRADNLDAAFASLKAKLFPTPPAPTGQDVVVTYLREQEIRSVIRSLSLAEQVSIYSDAAQTQKTELLRAFRLSPLPLAIDAETMDKLDRQYAEVNQADQVARLDALDEARAQLRSLATALQAWLSPSPDLATVFESKMAPAIQERNELGGKKTQQPPARSAADRPPAQQQQFV